ncbi:MAG: XRE family transcriptional regulator [Paracoccaceae bacterium]|jgi:transcriptional regulator with XRE-family HTH domain|nr:XRE family transcriptional regulator [Paracoccaceae bacterium]MDG1370222.1 XRE family transcriptional regulator [Paracoccaceae bacterium]MDG1972321.1 XRE family transcriptional regulator [Paracoccaceae bacterium]
MNDNPSSTEAESLLKIASSEGVGPPVAPLKLGERVRTIRRARNWTLEEAANRAGLARSTLSKIENEQMSPTFDAVQKLARGLDIDVPQLFQPAQVDKISGRRSITKANEGRGHPTSTYEHELLASEISRKRMLPYKAIIRARDFSEFDGWVRHQGEEFMLVLSGAVSLYTEFYEPVAMHEGDSAYYDGSMGHCVISISEDDAMILWVTSM